MCRQVKTGYADCPHVFSEEDVEHCVLVTHRWINQIPEGALEWADGDLSCAVVECVWSPLQVPGKCAWCREEDEHKETAARQQKRKALGDVKIEKDIKEESFKAEPSG
jgi:hypothetical protein